MPERDPRRKWTLVCHVYVGCNAYVVYLHRLMATRKAVEKRRKRYPVHYVIEGWPTVRTMDGKPLFKRGTNEYATDRPRSLPG